MRVLILSPLYPPHAQGGAELSAEGLAQWLVGRGHDVVVLTAAKGPDDEVHGERRDGVTLYRRVFPRPYSIHRQGRGVSPWLKPFWHLQDHLDPRNRRVVETVLDTVRPEVVTLHSLIGLGHNIPRSLAARDIPTLFVLPDLALTCLRATMYRRDRLCAGHCWECRISGDVKQSALRHIPRLGFVSPSQANLARLAAAGAIGGRPTRVIANVKAYPAPLKPRSPSPLPHFVYVGRLDAPKGVETLLLAAEEAQAEATFTLTILGAGREEQRLRHAFAGRDWLTFTGWRPLQDAVETIHQADALCLPSLWPENLPGAAVIALRHGVPILASATGGLPELVRDGVNGRLLPPADRIAWRQALVEMARRPEKRAAMGVAARAAARRFDPDLTGADYLDFMEEIRCAQPQRMAARENGLALQG